MLSNKMTFSLTCFVVLIAFGLACFAPSAFADGRDDDNAGRIFDLGVTISAAESMIDVSAEGDPANDIQIRTGRDRVSRNLDAFGAAADLRAITLLVEFTHVVNLAEPGGDLEDIEDVTVAPIVPGDVPPGSAVKGSGGNFGADDVYIAAYDKRGRALGVLPLSEIIADGDDATDEDFITSFRDDGAPSRQFLIRIDESHITNAYAQDDRAGDFEIYSFVFFIPQGVGNEPDPKDDKKFEDALVTRGIKKSSLDHAIAHFGPGAHHHLNKASNEFRVDLVDDDQGNPQYNSGVSATPIAANGDPGTAGSGTPGVVTVDPLRERAGFIESGPFDVRLILTEEPRGGLTPANILVEGGGSATKVTKGATLKGAYALPLPAQTNELTVEMASYKTMTDEDAALANLPEATGRDNMYHQYFVTIEPKADVDGYLTVSVMQFRDNVLPVGKQYIPLTPEQRRAVTLPDAEETVRDARTANETLMVRVSTAEDTTLALATAAYDARQVVLDAVANEKVLDKGLVIPGNGYLVLVADAGKAGVQASDAKIKEKVSAASKLYNTTSLGLPFPADNLDGFFRNGGSLSVVHLDIPDATGSGHDDAKASEVGDDYTGYTGAATKAYAAGDVIISEIMWGQDSGTADSQYIELHNMTETDIGIDNKEWAIVVGAAPSGFTVLDTVNNRSATGFWAVPGSGGATKVSQEYPSIIDLVSMSRVTDTTDGSAEASWAMSMRPSANIAGRRIGTPGAANSYVEPTMEEEEIEDTTEPMAPAATAGDIMITEIMVASDGGRLPQWIELKNVSMAAASLTGWSLEVENDPVDTDVVDSEVRIDLGDTEIGAGQVALVVTKESNRNSGVGDGDGDLRADRIIDVQSQASPDSARYSLLSEMAFMISLRPPQTGTVKVGNLGKGWDLPMSEGDRSSLIRREMSATAEIMGTDAAGWMLASDTMLDGAYTTTYYGDADDMGTPGYDAGGALPVELSKFGAKRDPLTDQVIITWETQSELNNAGFNIKRSQQKTSQFVVVNPTLIAGAGTTSEKQSYTYTDTAAQPNIVYYYQIEDVSFDGNRQTLTRAHRLKGHVGAAGKLTTLWGELKERE